MKCSKRNSCFTFPLFEAFLTIIFSGHRKPEKAASDGENALPVSLRRVGNDMLQSDR